MAQTDRLVIELPIGPGESAGEAWERQTPSADIVLNTGATLNRHSIAEPLYCSSPLAVTADDIDLPAFHVTVSSHALEVVACRQPQRGRPRILGASSAGPSVRSLAYS